MRLHRIAPIALSTMLAGTFAAGAAAQVVAPAAPAAAAAPGFGPGYVPQSPPSMLGIHIQPYYVPGLGAETGLRVMSVWPGYPADGVLDPGDIITRINGTRVRNVPEFRHAMAHAGPYVTLRLWNVRTGYVHDIAPIDRRGFDVGYPAAAGSSVTSVAP